MQDRYVGDVGDFAKYALLRRLAGTAGEQEIRLGVIWCLYPNETHNGDGRHISYLHRPEYAELDPKLFAVLQSLVRSGRRSIAAVADSGVLPGQTIFCDAVACLPKSAPSKREARLHHRSRWLEICFGVSEAAEIVFFDPDNGIEVPSIPKHHPNAGKYIYWDELALFWNRGQALLIYHHLNRTKPAADQVAQMTSLMRSNFDGAAIHPLVFRRGSRRVFWLVHRRTSVGSKIGRRANAFLGSGWAMHFDRAISQTQFSTNAP
jgi:hypothetical protein